MITERNINNYTKQSHAKAALGNIIQHSNNILNCCEKIEQLRAKHMYAAQLIN